MMVCELWVAIIIQALPAGGAESSRGLLGPRFVWMVVSLVAGARENFSSCQPFQTEQSFFLPFPWPCSLLNYIVLQPLLVDQA